MALGRNTRISTESEDSNRQSASSNLTALALLLILVLITFGGVHLFVFHRWWFPAPAADHATTIDHQFAIALWLLGGLFVAGQLVLAVLLFRGRSRGASHYFPGSWW